MGCVVATLQYVGVWRRLLVRAPAYREVGSQAPLGNSLLSYSDEVHPRVRSLPVMNAAQDLHWRPYTTHCSPCLVNYTYIVDIEEGGDQHSLLSRIQMFQVSNDKN